MANQDAQETGNFTTLRFSFPEPALAGVSRMRIIGNDLLIYTTGENTQEEFTKMNFSVVERQYKLHVSALNEKTFKDAFGDVEILENRSTSERFIATIEASDQEQYREFLGKDSRDLRVKQFRARYANTQHEEGERRPYQNYNQNWKGNGKGYNNYDQQNGGKGYNNYDQYNKGKGKGKDMQQSDKGKGRGKSVPSVRRNYSAV